MPHPPTICLWVHFSHVTRARLRSIAYKTLGFHFVGKSGTNVVYLSANWDCVPQQKFSLASPLEYEVLNVFHYALMTRQMTLLRKQRPIPKHNDLAKTTRTYQFARSFKGVMIHQIEHGNAIYSGLLSFQFWRLRVVPSWKSFVLPSIEKK